MNTHPTGPPAERRTSGRVVPRSTAAEDLRRFKNEASVTVEFYHQLQLKRAKLSSDTEFVFSQPEGT